MAADESNVRRLPDFVYRPDPERATPEPETSTTTNIRYRVAGTKVIIESLEIVTKDGNGVVIDRKVTFLRDADEDASSAGI